jgi:prepilin signal peptidase PulO-like enzyme (type II secretory pathway)
VSFTGYIVHLIAGLSEDEELIYSIFNPPPHAKLNVLYLVPFYGLTTRVGDGASNTSFGIYSIMQLVMGILTASIPFLVGDFDWWAFSFIILLWCGFLIAWIDYEHHIIPEELTWFLLFAGLLMSPAVLDVYDRICGAALGAFSMWMAMFVVGLLKRENTYAGGDVSFAAVAGAWVGVFFVPWYLLILSVIYICHTAPLRLKGVKWVPMGPALVLALLISMLILHVNSGRLL